MRPITILSLNTHKGFSSLRRRFILHDLREAIRAVGADIVFLQEVLGEHAGHAVRNKAWPAVPQYEFLADTLWSEFAYGRNAVYPDGHHGNALLSRYPILSQDNIDVSVQGHEERGLLHCTLQLPEANTRLHAVCVHLGLREVHRRAQIEQLCRFVDSGIARDEPLLIAGDFNDWRLRGHRLLMDCSGLSEVFELRNGVLARTFPARIPWLRLDRVYFRGLTAIGSQILGRRPWTSLSDHAGLAAEFQL